ncbi:MAG TPA: hypothetical protein VMJ93_13110, partial [Verrucomicrobiae bacterium]|nr:hypothetical protein [Verrucomicrobiae bacterium]
MVRESAKTTSRDLAQKLLNKRLAEAREGAERIKPTTVGALAALYLKSREAYWKPKTAEWAKGIWANHLKPTFGDRNPASILLGDLHVYLSKIKAEGVSDCYCNRHMVLLKAILRYGLRNKALRELPEFPEKFSEAPYVRTGHVDSWGFVTLCD